MKTWILVLAGWALPVFAGDFGQDPGYLRVDGPRPIQPSYGAISYPPPVLVTPLPKGCFEQDGACPRSHGIEIQLEREFWSIVVRGDADHLARWSQYTEAYIQKSQTPYQGRLRLLMTFSHMDLFAASSHSLPKALGQLRAWRRNLNLALTEMPHSANLLTMKSLMTSLQSFLLGWKTPGIEALNRAAVLPEIYGKMGVEGYSVGAIARIGMRDPEEVQRGVDIFADCTDEWCRFTTSLAPFKRLGTLLMVAQGQTYLQRPDEVKRLVQLAREEGQALGFPLQGHLDEVEKSLIGPGGLMEQWQKNKGIGLVRIPFGPMQDTGSCVYCHAGAEVPDHYYTYLDDEAS